MLFLTNTHFVIISLVINLITENEKKNILLDILASPGFKDSKRYAELLQFLMDKSVTGESLKETTIACEFFARDSSFDPGKESFVRSYISGLRKRIEHYYLTTPLAVTYKITIPKGQYNLHFESTPETLSEKKKFEYTKKHIAAGLLLLLIPVVTFYFGTTMAKKDEGIGELAKDPLLSSFVGTPSNKTIIALGDYFFYTDNNTSPQEHIYFRNPHINNEKDFQDWVNANPENKGKYQPLSFAFLRPSTSLCLQSIVNKFKFDKSNSEIKMASSLKWQDLETANVIFIGSLKTLYILDTLLQKTNFRYNTHNADLSIIDKNGSNTKSFHANTLTPGRFSEDYSVILKIPSSNNKSILILTGFNELGINGALKVAIEENFSETVNSNFKVRIHDSDHFTAICKVNGVHETVFGYKMQEFITIDSRK